MNESAFCMISEFTINVKLLLSLIYAFVFFNAKLTCMVIFFVVLFIHSLFETVKQQHGGLLMAYSQTILRPSPMSSPSLVVPVSFMLNHIV